MARKKSNGLEAKLSPVEGKIYFRLKTEIYPLEVIYSTAGFFIDRAYIFIDGNTNKEIVVSLKGKEKLNSKELSALKREFCNELLNNVLRLTVTIMNQKVREFVVGTALVSCLPASMLAADNYQNDILDTENIDWKDDPLGIAIPWEEKNTKKKKHN